MNRLTTDITTDCSTGGAAATEQTGAELAREMRRRWNVGERPAAEEFLAQRPGLWQQPEAAVELIYEEYCLRQSAGDEGHDVIERDILRRFPQWAGPLRVMLDCHRRVLESDRDGPRFPAVGERVGGFRLLSVLARGARGRVFLATEAALGDRPVVLKLTPLDGAEHLSLARLQHTNIVPLYSVVDDAARNVRVLCMPYFGRATLAALLESLAMVPLSRRTGRDVVGAIDAMRDPAKPQAAAAPAAARQMLAHVSYTRAMCWVAACLADALQFAHERGVVHLDLKPSNVLLSADGQPMLLDFHLAREPIRPGGPPPEHFGGTPPYMPPEQRAAMESLRRGRPVDVAVDGRADLYALGAMLYESLGGKLPLDSDSPPLWRVNPLVSRGLSDVVARCVAGDPSDRYPDAQGLADDLRRHLTDQPLAGVPNRSLAERWRKWRRRGPGRMRAVAMGVVVVGAAAAVLASLWSHARDRHRQAEAALYDGQRRLYAGHRGDAVQSFERGVGLLDGLPFEDGLRRQLRDQLASAQRLHLAEQLHRLAEDVRVMYATDAVPIDRVPSLAAQCDALWAKRDVVLRSMDPTAAADVAADLQDIAIFAADLHVRLSADSDAASPGRIRALYLLEEAESEFGPSAVLDQERRTHGLAPRSSPAPAPRTAWEHCVLGRAFLAAGDLTRAEEQLAAAVELDPAGRWPNFYRGVCAYRMARYDDAVAAFSVCVGTAPRVAGCFYNRALAYAALDRSGDALRDCEQTLALDPGHGEARALRDTLRRRAAAVR